MLCCIALGAIGYFIAGCAVEKGKVYEKDGKLYGKTEGLFKARWDDYYVRGISYSDGGFWNDAAADFARAIEKRSADQRRARTYGMHFIDYYPNRELGIAYYNLKKYQEAIKALEASLASEETARAKYYLDKARAAWLNETRLDKATPAVAVEFPPPAYRTKELAIAVKGKASDDFFVSNIVFNGKPSKLELSQKEISFQEEISLQAGKNVITLQSVDILGKSSMPFTLEVKVDREGPLVFVEVAPAGGSAVLVSGAIYDKSAVAKIRIHNRDIAPQGMLLVKLNERFELTGPADEASLQFEAADSLGNVTKGLGAARSSAGTHNALSINDLPRVASAGSFMAFAKQEGRASEIELRGLRDGLAVYLDSITVQGNVRSAEGIDDLVVNRQSLLSAEEDPSITPFLKLVRENGDRPLAFSITLPLKEGQNIIAAELSDTRGVKTSDRLAITRNIPRVMQVGSRLSIAILPFTEVKKTGDSLQGYVQTFLNRSFTEQQRFSIVERDRLRNVLDDQQLSRKGDFDQETALRLGRLVGCDAVLCGSIASSPESIEIIGQLLDTGTATVLSENDVYWEGEMTAGFKGVLDDLALKFKKHLPLCEGMVTKYMPNNSVVIDVGQSQLIRQGMKFLAYQETAPLIDAESGMNLGSDTDILGQLATREVTPVSCKADIEKKFAGCEIKAGSKVIAK
jgi:tetratricopeptide (TPR) repeat protein